MIVILASLFACVLLVILIPVSVLFVQVLMARGGGQPAATGPRPRLAVLVPAHNEEAGLAATLAALMPQLRAGDRVLVVADNCSDGTAAVARAAGALAVERHHDTERGKGYALDFGVRQLAADPPEVVIIIDADCHTGPGVLDRIATDAVAANRPVQALYLMYAAADSGLMKKVAQFAWLVKNHVRPLGYLRLNLPCPLMGSGMAFPWQLISTASLASGHIVEDMKLGADLARAGHPPLFCPDVLVSSTFPVSASGTQSQRTRWEHGHLSMILSDAPGMLGEGLRRRNSALLAMALDLSVPPVALLCLGVLAAFVLSAVFSLLSGAMLPLWLASAALAMTVLAILLAWWRYGRTVLSAANLALAVGYIFWKVPVYLRFLVRRQVDWVRSKRDSE